MAKASIYNNAHWRKFRNDLLGDVGCSCYLCQKKKWIWQPRKKMFKSVGRFEIHHLHYDSVGHETKDDVRVLCCSCHRILSEIMHRKAESSFIQLLQQIVTDHIER